MNRILWLSKHPPIKAQVDALRTLYPEVKLMRDSNVFGDVQDIIDRLKAMSYVDLVVVAPDSIIRKLTEQDIYPLWAEMQGIHRPKYPNKFWETPGAGGRWYRFVRFHRVTGITWQLENPIGGNNGRNDILSDKI